MIYYSKDVDGQKVDPNVMANPDLSHSARWLYAMLCFITPDENFRNDEIADALDISLRTFIMLRAELESQGYIIKIRSGKEIRAYIGNSVDTPKDVKQYWS